MIAEQQNCAGRHSPMRHVLNGVILKLSCLPWECNDLALHNSLREKVDFPTQQLNRQLRMTETALQLCEKETGNFVLGTLDLPEQTKAVSLEQLKIPRNLRCAVVSTESTLPKISTKSRRRVYFLYAKRSSLSYSPQW
jgi:hypothetical protein